MKMIQLVGKLGRNDLKLIGRDQFLLFMLGFVLFMALTLRLFLPWMDTYLAEVGLLPGALAIRFADLYPMLVTFFLVFQGALLSGVVFGFLLLDERDDNTIKAMLVTPVPLNRYVAYRVGVPAVLAFFVVIVEVSLVGQALIPAGQLLWIAAGASLTAPIATLFFSVFAENKVQGFALSKFVGLVGYVIVFGWFVAEPWQWLFGLFPPFWISKAYWMAFAGDAGWEWVLIVGVLLQAALIGWLIRRFNKEAYR